MRMDHEFGLEQKGSAPLEILETQIAKIPATAYLCAGCVSIMGSAALQWLGRGQRSVFIGHWAPTFFVLGLYARVMKQRGEMTLQRVETSSDT